MAQTEWAPTEVAAPAKTIYASFADLSLAEKAAGALMDYGVREEDVSLVAKRTDPFAGERGYVEGAVRDETFPPASPVETEDVRSKTELEAKAGLSTTTPEDAAAGAAKGAGIGLGVGVLAAIASIFVPGFGLVAGGGALATAIAGAAATTAGGAIAGGVHGYLKDQGIPEEAVKLYVQEYHSGGAILAVTVPSNGVDEMTAERVLSKYQGNHIGVFGPYSE